MKHALTLIIPVAAVSASLAVSGCKTLEAVAEAGAQIGVATGTISSNQAESIVRSSKAVSKTFADITPEQEYYIGRAVAASILEKYSVYREPHATHYVNLVGRTVAAASDRPETFGGYHFLILDSDEVNAFAAPGGFIMVTRGMLRCCPTEDALAAVLAHEVGHVQNKDGLRAIKKSRLTSALNILAAEGAKQFGGSDLREVVTAFEGSVQDVTETLVNNGYSRRLEKQADLASLSILKRVGYDPHGLADMLNEMGKRMHPGSGGFARTHPGSDVRLKSVAAHLPSTRATASASRTTRFERMLGSI